MYVTSPATVNLFMSDYVAAHGGADYVGVRSQQRCMHDRLQVDRYHDRYQSSKLHSCVMAFAWHMWPPAEHATVTTSVHHT